ncbi:hypothetical protein GMLC_06410 [Geomonas limicola]|uniref:Lipoprotein n=1 Tax=Geomonas limicola TaxID=2740186 RepID=A0A6V8N3D9_9BACT|nr:hypothetical protein [Geomonas limicola]GFO67062.1 hypothetical protein GMLC_06410 [Geomonas limicola]
MKRIERFSALLFILVLGLLAGCGGGSSAPASPPATTTTTTTPPTTPTTPATPQTSQVSTKATVKLSTQGVLPQGALLSGLAVTIQLPSGTTIATDASTSVATGEVSVSGVAAQAGGSVMLPPVYAPATATTPATLQIIIAGNFGVGEFATFSCSTAPGSTLPSSSNLSAISFTPTDQQLRPVTGLSAGVSVTLLQ